MMHAKRSSSSYFSPECHEILTNILPDKPRRYKPIYWKFLNVSIVLNRSMKSSRAVTSFCNPTLVNSCRHQKSPPPGHQRRKRDEAQSNLNLSPSRFPKALIHFMRFIMQPWQQLTTSSGDDLSEYCWRLVSAQYWRSLHSYDSHGSFKHQHTPSNSNSERTGVCP